MKPRYQENGRLQEDFLPAIYLDTSFLIEYWMAEALEGPGIWEELGVIPYEIPYDKFIKDLLRADVKIQKVFKIREMFLTESLDILALTSPLATLEMIEWKAEATLKQIIADKVGALSMYRKGKKNIGDYLKKVLDARQKEIDEEIGFERGENGLIIKTGPTPPMELLVGDTSMVPSYFSSHALHGIVLCDLKKFNITMSDVWGILWPYAYIQLGLADCLHLFAAHHLGCKYFGSLDSDFRRIKDIVKKELDMEILSSPEEIIQIF